MGADLKVIADLPYSGMCGVLEVTTDQTARDGMANQIAVFMVDGMPAHGRTASPRTMLDHQDKPLNPTQELCTPSYFLQLYWS